MVDQANPFVPTEAQMHTLPTVDMQAPEDQIVQQIYQVMTTTGFLTLSNIEGFDEQRLANDIKEFHSMPEDEKKKLYTK